MQCLCQSITVLQQTYFCLQKSGNITYNGHKLDEFHVQRTSAYISQTDNHIAELTVRETFDFAARCQGANEGFAGWLIYDRLTESRNSVYFFFL